MAQQQLLNMSTWHKNIFNWEIQHPGENMSVCAEYFGVTETWLSLIKNSDIYREYVALQQSTHSDNVSKSVIESVEELAGVSVEVLKERIEDERKTIGLGVVNDTAALALKALGFGNKNNGRGDVNAQVNVFLGAADPKVLERARGKMRLVNAHTEPACVGADTALPVIVDEVEDAEDPKPLPTPA